MTAASIMRTEAPSGAFDLAATIALAFAITGLPVLLHLVAPALAIAFSVACAIVLAWRFDRAAPVVLLVAYLFQSTFVAMASSAVVEYSDLDSMKAYNFVTTIGVWLTLVARLLFERGPVSPFVRRMMIGSSIVIAIAGVYFVIGLAIDTRGAIIYMRNLCLPMILFQIGLIVAARHGAPTLSTIVVVLTMVLVCGYVELLWLEGWLDFTNGWTYWDLASAARRQTAESVRDARETGIVAATVVDLLTTNFLNSTLVSDLALRVVRLQGPNFHPISFGYALAILTSILAAHGRILLPLAAAPLLLVIGAKGALVLVALCVAYCALARRFAGLAPPIALGVALAAFAAFAFTSGLAHGDFHVLGLIGGLTGFAGDPIGHSLGEGGNLSTNFAAIDWSKYQHAGATDIAVESAIGVLLYQTGVAGFGILAIYLWLARTGWRLHAWRNDPSLALVSAVIPIILVNGLFQEEAMFAPLALGLALWFAGLTLGAVDHAVAGPVREGRLAQLRPAMSR
jgi:hypothetical protein